MTQTVRRQSTIGLTESTVASLDAGRQEVGAPTSAQVQTGGSIGDFNNPDDFYVFSATYTWEEQV